MSRKPCPYCDELIQEDAAKCRFCGEWLAAGGAARARPTDVHEAPEASAVPPSATTRTAPAARRRGLWVVPVLGVVACGAIALFWLATQSDRDLASVAGDDTAPASVDFRVVQHDGPSGVVVLLERPGARSARRLLVAAANDLRPHFEGNLELLGGAVDKADRDAQAFFTTRLQGMDLQGVVHVVIGESGGTVALMYDQPHLLAGSLPRLRRLWMPPGAASRPATAAAVQWKVLAVPDGSGTLRVPEGWEIVGAQRGMVSARGPHGIAELGVTIPIHTPTGAYAQFRGQGGPTMFLPLMDPVAALPEVYNFYYRNFGRIIDSAPLDAPSGRGAAILFEGNLPDGTRFRGLGHFISGPINADQWMFYLSYVATTVAAFDVNLPILLEIWRNRALSDRFYRESFDRIAGSLSETRNILDATRERREDAFDRSNRAWNLYIQDNWPTEDMETGRRTMRSDDIDLQALVDGINREAGSDRYRVVPYDEINR